MFNSFEAPHTPPPRGRVSEIKSPEEAHLSKSIRIKGMAQKRDQKGFMPIKIKQRKVKLEKQEVKDAI